MCVAFEHDAPAREVFQNARTAFVRWPRAKFSVLRALGGNADFVFFNTSWARSAFALALVDGSRQRDFVFCDTSSAGVAFLQPVTAKPLER